MTALKQIEFPLNVLLQKKRGWFDIKLIYPDLLPFATRSSPWSGPVSVRIVKKSSARDVEFFRIWMSSRLVENGQVSKSVSRVRGAVNR